MWKCISIQLKNILSLYISYVLLTFPFYLTVNSIKTPNDFTHEYNFAHLLVTLLNRYMCTLTK